MNKNNIMVGKILCKRRMELGLSMRQLALIVGVSHTEISRIESGQRGNYNVNILARICKVLGINFLEIINMLSGLEQEEFNEEEINEYEVIAKLINQRKCKVNAYNEYEALEKITKNILNDENFILENYQFIEYEIKNLTENLK